MKKTDNKVSERVADYRMRNQREGIRRVETTVAAADINLIKEVARALREGGSLAVELRSRIRSILPAAQAQTADELLAFFQSSPLKEEDQQVFDRERDRSNGRTADFE